MYMYFKDLPIGCEFLCNNTRYKKQSSRTALYLANTYQWFYFGKNELCVKE